MVDFHETRFPVEISYGSKGGPKFKTTVLELDSGYEQRNINWSKARAEYDVSHGIKTRAQMNELREFFYARKGMAYGFRYKDWADYKVANQTLGTGNGSNKDFQAIKTYTNGGVTYTRTLNKLVASTITAVLVNGVSSSYTVNNDTGVITMTSAPANGHSVALAYAEFDVPVRFGTDHLDAEHDFWEGESWTSIPLIEVRI